MNIDEIVFGCKAIAIPSLSKENFIKYGKSSLSSINQIIVNQNYIIQEDAKNKDGLWTTKLGKKPLSISFN